MPTLIQNARILTPFAQINGSVLIAGERIAEVAQHIAPPRNATVIDARGLYLVPGFIDVHAHSGGGRDIMEGNVEAVLAMARAHATQGTTTILPTTQLAPLEEMDQVVTAVREAAKQSSDSTIAGVHLAGPLLSPQEVVPEKHRFLQKPADEDWRAIARKWKNVRMIDVAPELPDALELGDIFREQGIVTSISHSRASSSLVQQAMEHGFTDVSEGFLHSVPSVQYDGFFLSSFAASALSMDGLSVQLMADDERMPMMMLQIIYRCKGPENIMLVTNEGDLEFDYPAKQAPLTIAKMIRNMVAAGVMLRVALRMATVNPSRCLGLEHSKGRIDAGYDADLLLLDDALQVCFCMARGKILRNSLDDAL